ncbi:MAG: T9SS type A sorting domain-containing protein [Ignavibacteria bacterium]|nr:T9SS type A sorting domain-containing protein [Ignavibacteria bacterium]
MSNPESENPRLQIFTDDPYDKYDSKRFNKEDRKAIRENVINSFQTSRDIEIEKVKSLEKKVREGNAGKNERSALNVKKILSEVIKIKKPRDITEHINNVNGNIQKVFGATNDQNSNEVINIIPTEYSLSQNYPNPFNPTTKINFSLPEDGKIKLTIYDILGREVNRLINSEFRSAGRYTVEFNGAGLSSGVYFYRIDAGKFVQTKRMVLLK